MIDLAFRNLTRTTNYGPSFFLPLIKRTLEAVSLNAPTVEISISLVGLQKMRALNQQYRGKDSPTDVISFPLGETPLKGYTVRTLGDIFICPAYAAAKAREERVDMQEKMAWLAVHGLLHLIGYDHERSRPEAAEMVRLEKIILKP